MPSVEKVAPKNEGWYAMSLLRMIGLKKKRFDDDPRMPVTRDISPEDFIKVNDQTFEYRERVLPRALTIEFWEGSGLVNFLLTSGGLKSEVLDVGCGSGEIDIILAQNGYSITGLDISPYAIKIAQKHRAEHVKLKDRLRFIVGDIETADIDKRFSSAIISHTLEHVLSPEKTVENTISHLKPGSTILVAVPNRKAWRERTHLRCYSKWSMKRFLRPYCRELDVRIDPVERMIFAVMQLP